MDTVRARTELGWRPRYTSLEALRATLHPDLSERDQARTW
jgi:nucleoside-diphosphate-sugar epimerase